ncbi:hypothetical protein [Micromonospora sp. DT47]|uniref:hypothetical protein n=1 Tax=Micromonospora sp. DT47 TaxID=3393431 RepID=UPI003CF96A09
MGRRVVATVAALLLASAVGCDARIHGDRDLTHGGDAIKVNLELRLADEQEAFRAAAVALGAPADKQRGMVPGHQAVVVKLVWTDSAQEDGWFHLIALDKRVTPPIPLVGDGSWSGAGSRGALGSSAYDALAKRYDWLASLGLTQSPDGSWTRRYPTPAVAAPASRAGTATAWWFNPLGEDDRLPLTDPGVDIALALVYEDKDGDLRWVKRIAG